MLYKIVSLCSNSVPPLTPRRVQKLLLIAFYFKVSVYVCMCVCVAVALK